MGRVSQQELSFESLGQTEQNLPNNYLLQITGRKTWLLSVSVSFQKGEAPLCFADRTKMLWKFKRREKTKQKQMAFSETQPLFPYLM